MVKTCKKRFIIRRLDKLSGVRQTITIWAKDGILHTITKEIKENGQTKRV
jgi:hypothetical protein